ncbi:MAG: hypothetical protein ABGW69_01735 [Nanoarchaeota archaeon]
MNLHYFYNRFKFLEKYIPDYLLREKNLLRALNFVDIKMLDKEYILLSFGIWLFLFFLFLIIYLLILIFNPSFLLNFIAITQLFLAILVLIIYYYPFYLQKVKLENMKQEFTLFFLHLKILIKSGLNFNQIFAYFVSNKELPYETIRNEFVKAYNYSKLYGVSLEKSFKRIIENYPSFYVKSILLEFVNYQKEKKDLTEFAEETWKRINLINEEQESKFFNKLDFFMDFYSIILLLFPFLLILITFIFESVNFIFDKLTSSNVNINPFNTLFAKTIIVLLILLPIFYIIFLVFIDSMVPPHLKYLKKLKERFVK